MIEKIEDDKKLEKYNKHIYELEALFKSIVIKGSYEQYRLAPCLMLFNFIDLLRGVAILDYNHMLVSGNIIIRSMFEILVDFLYCETNRKLYLRFGEYQNVNRVLLYEKISKEIQDKINKEDYKNITLPKYLEFKTKYNIKNERELYNWSGKTLFKRVKILSQKNPEILELYYNIYIINCDYTHNFAGTMTKYVNYNNGNLNANYRNSYDKDRFYLIKQINSLADIFYNEFKNLYENVNLADLDF